MGERSPAVEPVETSRAPRKRIVMLVDNGVEGDSRVQKQARSTAERGWDVVLLGRSPDKKTHRWKIGEARVRLVPMPNPLMRGRRKDGSLPPGYARQLAKARLVDVTTRRDAAAYQNGGSSVPVRAWYRLRREYAAQRLRLAERRKPRKGRGRKPPAVEPSSSAVEPVEDRWVKRQGTRAWRRLDPGLWDWELAYGPVIDKLQPDVIHANDFRMLGVGARAKLRAWSAGRDVKLVWDSHEFLPGRDIHHQSRIWHRAQILHEAEHAQYADAVVTTSEMMADLLTRQHGLTLMPTVVRNAPTLPSVVEPVEATPGVRALCGLGDDVPLLIYTGVTAPQRGVDTMIEALPQLDGVHVVLLARPSANRDRLTNLAEELGVADRVHPLPYVPVDQIVPHISSADVGVFPALHNLSHDSDLPTKFYEYAQARLPMVVSDVKTTAETTRMLGQGEIFAAGDVDDYVRAVRTVLADLSRYRAAYDTRPDLLEEWTWEHQADILADVYAQLLR
jgi:glycogen(starch) synthase